MGDRRLTSFDVLDQIQNSLTVDLPPNWLSTVCALPQLGGLVDSIRSEPAPQGAGLEAVTEALLRTGGHAVLGVLMACRDCEVDFGLLLINAIADRLEYEKGNH